MDPCKYSLYEKGKGVDGSVVNVRGLDGTRGEKIREATQGKGRGFQVGLSE